MKYLQVDNSFNSMDMKTTGMEYSGKFQERKTLKSEKKNRNGTLDEEHKERKNARYDGKKL